MRGYNMPDKNQFISLGKRKASSIECGEPEKNPKDLFQAKPEMRKSQADPKRNATKLSLAKQGHLNLSKETNYDFQKHRLKQL